VAAARLGKCGVVSRPSGKNFLTRVTGVVVISAVDILTYVVLSVVENHVPYGQLVGIKECLTLYPSVSYKPRSF
jgi:hypothetical protein